MEFAVEKVEKICRHTGVSSEQARQALEETGGNQLDAVILLEERGWTQRPRGGTWSTRWESPADAEAAERQEQERRRAAGRQSAGKRRGYTAQEVGDAIKSLFQNCTKITIDIWRGDELLAGIPLIICILLFLVVPHIMIPLALIGLIVMGCRYHISGWAFGEETVNRTMDEVSKAVNGWMAPIRKRVKREVKRFVAEMYVREHQKQKENETETDENKE